MFIKTKKEIKPGDKLYFNTVAKRKVNLKTSKRTKNDVLVGWAISYNDNDNYVKIQLYHETDKEYCDRKGIDLNKFCEIGV